MTGNDERMAAMAELVRAEAIETAAQEARTYAAWLNGHGYTAVLWHFTTALTNHGPESRRTQYAHGFAVSYEGTLIRDDGSQAEHPVPGIAIAVFCQATQLALGNLIHGGRAMIAIGNGSGRAYSRYTPYYVAGWNPRESDVQRDPALHGGTGIVPIAILHELTPMIGGDGPKRFYDLRLDPAGGLVPGDRVRVTGGELGGDTATVRTVITDISGEPCVTVETDSGRYRTVPVAVLAAQ